MERVVDRLDGIQVEPSDLVPVHDGSAGIYLVGNHRRYIEECLRTRSCDFIPTTEVVTRLGQDFGVIEPSPSVAQFANDDKVGWIPCALPKAP